MPELGSSSSALVADTSDFCSATCGGRKYKPAASRKTPPTQHMPEQSCGLFNRLIKVAEGFLRILCTQSARKVQPPEVTSHRLGGYNSLIIWARIWIRLETLAISSVIERATSL